MGIRRRDSGPLGESSFKRSTEDDDSISRIPGNWRYNKKKREAPLRESSMQIARFRSLLCLFRTFSFAVPQVSTVDILCPFFSPSRLGHSVQTRTLFPGATITSGQSATYVRRERALQAIYTQMPVFRKKLSEMSTFPPLSGGHTYTHRRLRRTNNSTQRSRSLGRSSVPSTLPGPVSSSTLSPFLQLPTT